MPGKYCVAARLATVFASLVIVLLVSPASDAYRVCTFKGTVIDHGWRSMTVKTNGQCAEVNVGWRTKYIPNRRPCIGESVAVDFMLEDGYMKATKVVSLSPLPPSAQCFPPAPPGTSECRTVGGEPPSTVTDGCPPSRAIVSTRPPAHVSDPGWSPTSPPPSSEKPPSAAAPVKKPSAPDKKEAAKTPPPPAPQPPREEVKEPVPSDDKKAKVLSGEVVASSPKSLSLRVLEEGEAAEVINIKVGLKTKFVPFRRPAVGEKVKVEYRQENGDKFGYTVQVIQ